MAEVAVTHEIRHLTDAGRYLTRRLLTCQQPLAPPLWFADAPDDIARAQSLCQCCPLRRSCLDGALDRAERWGVWGGEIFHDGSIVDRKPRVGRPRMHGAAA